MAKTKIIATLGPSSGSAPVIARMMRAGLDVVRLNFSHGTPEGRLRCIAIVRQLNMRTRRHIRILGDLEGHRIRIGSFKDQAPIELKKGQTFRLVQKEVLGEGDFAPFDYRGPLADIKKGQHIYIDDGRISLKILSISKKTIKTRVIIPGILKEHKGVNIPDARLKFPGMTLKDKMNIDFCVQEKLDYIAQSFVRTARDIRQVKNRAAKKGAECKVIAKIENREGIRNIDAIIGESDGIMVARGDMGICIPVYEVPVVQKEVIRKCNEKKKFVITATQMLEHMVEDRMPTRAEVTDVANAVLDGTDFVMLSEETAAGAYPAEAVDMMNKIIRFTEASRYMRQTLRRKNNGAHPGFRQRRIRLRRKSLGFL